MANIQVRDVPADVHQGLIQQADRAGQSLQQYLSRKLAEIAATPTLEDVLDRIETLQTGRLSAADTVAVLRSDRDSH